MQEVEDVVRLCFVATKPPEPEARDGARPPRKVIVPEEIKLLDRCVDAAAAHLPPDPMTVDAVQEIVGCSLVDLFPDFSEAPLSFVFASGTNGPGLRLQVCTSVWPARESVRMHALFRLQVCQRDGDACRANVHMHAVCGVKRWFRTA
jgi:hypothetical protein